MKIFVKLFLKFSITTLIIFSCSIVDKSLENKSNNDNDYIESIDKEIVKTIDEFYDFVDAKMKKK